MSVTHKLSNASVTNCIHRGISRLRAEQLLLAAKQDGSFLIRDSETVPGAYTLCILIESRVHQYRILPDSDGKLSVQSEAGVRNRKFVDLTQLIHEYVQRGPKNGLAGPLCFPIAAESISDDENDTDEERVEDEGDPLQCEIEAPSGNTSDDAAQYCVSNGSTMKENDFDDFVFRYFIQRFKHLDLSSCDGSFINTLKLYVETGTAKDAHLSCKENHELLHLRGMLEEATKDFEKSLENFMKKIDICRQLFGPITTTPLINNDKSGRSRKSNLAGLLEQMSKCKSAVQNLEKKADLKYQDLMTMWKEGGVMMTSDTVNKQITRGLPNKPIIPATSFEAKVQSMSSQSKIKLTVDIQAGKLLAIKPNKECLNDKNVFTHDRIEQLIKCTTNNSRLDIKILGMKKKTYTFEDVRQRENFCQLVQQLKNTHSVDPEVKRLSIYIGSWNMGSEIPMYCLQPWLRSDGLGKKRNKTLGMIPHDMYIIGTQESALSDKEWTNRIRSILMETFGEEFYLVAIASLWSLRIVIFAKNKHKNRFSHIQQSSVKTGLANTLGNKGAVGISLAFSGTNFCFVNAHLTSGNEKLKRRNQNFHDIIKGLDLGPKNSFDVTNNFHHMFFFGDLNYRIDDLDSNTIIKKIKDSTGNYASLLTCDQLKRSQQQKDAFVGFSEEEITFPPTYRFKKGTRDRYAWQKFKTTGTRINAPSWCDRVLCRSYPDTWISNTSYGCVEQICSSDHKPVFSSFEVRVVTQFTSSKGGNAQSGDMKIIFEEISAEVRTSKQDNFKVEFCSACLDSSKFTKQNVSFASKKEGYCCPKWSAEQLPELLPIVDDWDYLEDQHLLVAVKTADGMESYGECVLPLRTVFAVNPQPFCCTLTHFGEETGMLRGMMHVKSKDNTPALIARTQKSNKIYDLIYMDTDFGNINETEATPIYEDFKKPDEKKTDATLPKQKTSVPSDATLVKQKTSVPSIDSKSLVPGVTMSHLPSGASSQMPIGTSNLCSSSTHLPTESSSRVPIASANQLSGGSSAVNVNYSIVQKNTNRDNHELTTVSLPNLISEEYSNSVSLSNHGMQDNDALGACGGSDTKGVQDGLVYESTAPDLPPRRRLNLPNASCTDSNAKAAWVPSEYANDKKEVPVANIRPTARFSALLGNVDPNETNCKSLLSKSTSAIKDQPDKDNPTSVEDEEGLYCPVEAPKGSSKEAKDGTGAASNPPPENSHKVFQNLEYFTQSKLAGSVKEWLSCIGMSQYTNDFLKNGWDHINFLSDMTEADLIGLGISKKEHRNVILEQINKMKK